MNGVIWQERYRQEPTKIALWVVLSLFLPVNSHVNFSLEVSDGKAYMRSVFFWGVDEEDCDDLILLRCGSHTFQFLEAMVQEYA